jgi:Ca-activated chloride channel family protein
MFNAFEFAKPDFLYLLLLLPFVIAWYWWKHKTADPVLTVSVSKAMASGGRSFRQSLVHLPFILRIIIFVLLVIVLARPQSSSTNRTVTTEGIDIVISLDISTSMLAEDFKPNRLEAAKKTALEFIDARINDRIGLVVFAGQSFTQCPITFDHAVLKNLFQSIKSADKMSIEDGTAIGMGLATAVDRLKDSRAKSKVIILLTDGVNNTGIVSPLTAADIAKAFNIRVYTIGVGTRGKAPYPVMTPFGKQYMNVDVEIDESVLKQIAETTGGKYFRATGNKALENIYKEIDKLEKTKIDEAVFTRKTEEYYPFALAAAFLLLLDLLLRFVYLRKLP